MHDQKEVIPKVLEKYRSDKTGLTGLTEHINNKEIRPYSSHRGKQKAMPKTSKNSIQKRREGIN